MKKRHQHRWFSILMALWIVAVLMIMVTGLAMMYMREFKLSRLSYDEILASANAEWAFEYAMLKIRNHEAGFQDSMKSETDKDGEFFKLSTPRSEWLQVEYKIEASGTKFEYILGKNQSLVIPLFVDEWEKWNDTTWDSKKPHLKTSKINPTEWLQIKTNNNNNIAWSIIAENENSEDFYNKNIALQWKGEIVGGIDGKVRFKTALCIYEESGNIHKDEASDSRENNCEQNSNFTASSHKEVVEYDYEKDISVEKFIKWEEIDIEAKAKNPYLMITNIGNASENITIEATKDFTFPEKKITAIAKKWNASQVFTFSEDKSLYYQDLLTVYNDNTQNSTP